MKKTLMLFLILASIGCEIYTPTRAVVGDHHVEFYGVCTYDEYAPYSDPWTCWGNCCTWVFTTCEETWCYYDTYCGWELVDEYCY